MNEAVKAWLVVLERPTLAYVGATLGTPDTLIEIVASAAKQRGCQGSLRRGTKPASRHDL